MACLTDVEIQAIVDEEATAAARQHAAACARCRHRVEQRRGQMQDIGSAMHAFGDVPATLTARVHQSIGSHGVVRGSTMLRPTYSGSWRRARWISAAATAAAVGLVVFVFLPRLGAPTRLSASQVLERSLQTLSSTTGVESLEYELTVDGVAGGPFRISHLIDRANPNHYRIASYGSDGRLRTAVSQDPATRQRTQAIQVDGRNYIVKIDGIHQPVLSLPQMAQALLESVIGMMQATADPTLTLRDSPRGPEYIVETPQRAPRRSAATLELYHARAVIGAQDFRIHEFEGSGTLLRQPFALTFTLLQQTIVDRASTNFAIEPGPDDVVLEGQAGEGAVEELITTIVREMERARGR